MKERLGNYISEYSVRNKDDQNIPVYSVTNANGFCTEYFGKEVASKDKKTYKLVPRNYFAYNPSRINVGSIDCQTKEDIVIVSPLYVVFSADDRIDNRYLYYYLKSDVANYYIREKATGSVRDNLKFSMLAEFPIKIRPLDEQHNLAKRLDLLKKLIDNYQTEISLLDQLIKSRFVEIFGDPVYNEKGWPTKALLDVCESIVDCPHSTPLYTQDDTGYMCIRTSIVKKSRIEWDKIEYISKEEYLQRIQRKKPQKGDVIYTREGAILGIAAVIDQDCNVALGQRSMLLSPNEKYCASTFLSVAMNFDSFLDKALKGMSGSASPHINVGDIKAFKMIMPPVCQQKLFSDFVEQINKSKLAQVMYRL